MVYINMLFSLSHLAIFGGKPENCETRTASGKTLITSAGLGFKPENCETRTASGKTLITSAGLGFKQGFF